MSKGIIRWVLKVYGRVQGVNFRWRTQQIASKLGAKGWVANLMDGTVLVVVEAGQDVLQRFGKEIVMREECGPYVERVDLIMSEELKDESPSSDFEIVREWEEIKKRVERMNIAEVVL